MAFLKPIKNCDFNYQQQRINLSKYAMQIIENDISNFNIDAKKEIFNKSNFICTVFINSKGVLDSFVSKRIMDIDTQYNEFFEKDDKFCPKVDDADLKQVNASIVKKMRCQEEQRCREHIKKINSSKFKSFIIFLNTETTEFIRRGEESEFHYEGIIYNDKLSTFLKTVIEEYCELPFYKREKTVFRKNIEQAEKIIAENKTEAKSLKDNGNKKVRKEYKTIRLINNRNGREDLFTIIPFSICCDINKSYNYLICYAKRDDTDRYMPAAFRLSHIRLIPNTEDTVKTVISEEHSDILYDWLINGYNMFNNETIPIKVRFTEAGITLYEMIRYHRPVYTKKKGSVYEFNCTFNEALYYFSQFGAETIVLEPDDLRFELKERFVKAAKRYCEDIQGDA